jgi:hypothetical protein
MVALFFAVEKAKVPTADRLGYRVIFDTPHFISAKHLFSFAAFYYRRKLTFFAG